MVHKDILCTWSGIFKYAHYDAQNLKQTRSNIRRCIYTLASVFFWPSRAFPREADERRLITLFPEGRNAQGQRFAGVFRLHLYLSERKRERRSLYLAKEIETVSHWMLLIRQLPTPCTLSNPHIIYIYLYTYIYTYTLIYYKTYYIHICTFSHNNNTSGSRKVNLTHSAHGAEFVCSDLFTQ